MLNLMKNRVPRLLSIRPFSILVSGAILLFLADAIVGQTAWSGTQDTRHPKVSTPSKHSRVKGTPASLAPVTVMDLRATSSPRKSSLVLDLVWSSHFPTPLSAKPHERKSMMGRSRLPSSSLKCPPMPSPYPFRPHPMDRIVSSHCPIRRG